MKKIVIILLAVLPIFLIVVISFAGRVFSEVSHIQVESVAFVDDKEVKYPDQHTIVLNKGDKHYLKVKVYPELASNQNVTYISSNNEICTVDANGVVTAVGNQLGTAYIIVKTDERAMTDRIRIQVINTNVEYVHIVDSEYKDVDALEMSISERIRIYAEVLPVTAKETGVTWTSSDPTIATVSATGMIEALKPGTVTITVTTKDGGITDFITVVVNENVAKISFNFDSNPNIVPFGTTGYGYKTSLTEFVLKDYLVYDQSIINPEDIIIEITSGDAVYNSETGVLVINSQFITIVATLNDGSGVTARVNIILE